MRRIQTNDCVHVFIRAYCIYAIETFGGMCCPLTSYIVTENVRW
jgi:hypothetical protein